uniref:hypothetical protein n=1 Tax=Siminovitchia fortis TaxID=254758 RepID=UPI001C92C06A
SEGKGEVEVEAVLREGDIEVVKVKGYKVRVMESGEEGEKVLREEEEREKEKGEGGEEEEKIKVLGGD